MPVKVESEGIYHPVNVDLLKIAESYLQEWVHPQAITIDSNPDALREAIAGLGDRSLLALRLPKAWGGAELSEASFRTFQETVSRYSGALAFLQTQHQSAANLLARSENDALKQTYLPYMSQGEILVGVGFSQLRRQGTPPVTAIPIAGGYQLEGIVPWVTGWGLFQAWIVGAILPDNRAVFGLVPFANTTQAQGGEIVFSTPMQLAAMNSTQTVSASLKHWFLAESNVLFTQPAGWIHTNDQKNVLHHGFFALGCARSGLDIVEAAAKAKPLPFITETFQSLDEELIACRTVMMQELSQPKTFAERLQQRAWAIELGVRCAHAAIAVSSGAANSSNHAAQRVYREALVFTIFGQTTEVMQATLARLVRPH